MCLRGRFDRGATIARIIVLLVLAALMALALMGYLVQPPGDVPFPP